MSLVNNVNINNNIILESSEIVLIGDIVRRFPMEPTISFNISIHFVDGCMKLVSCYIILQYLVSDYENNLQLRIVNSFFRTNMK